MDTSMLGGKSVYLHLFATAWRRLQRVTNIIPPCETKFQIQMQFLGISITIINVHHILTFDITNSCLYSVKWQRTAFCTNHTLRQIFAQKKFQCPCLLTFRFARMIKKVNTYFAWMLWRGSLIVVTKTPHIQCVSWYNTIKKHRTDCAVQK